MLNICVSPLSQLVSVPSGVDYAEAVSLVLETLTAYQMLHRCAHIKSGSLFVAECRRRHQLGPYPIRKIGRIKGVWHIFSQQRKTSIRAGTRPIDYKSVDFVQEIFRLTGNGVDIVFDGLGCREKITNAFLQDTSCRW